MIFKCAPLFHCSLPFRIVTIWLAATRIHHHHHHYNNNIYLYEDYIKYCCFCCYFCNIIHISAPLYLSMARAILPFRAKGNINIYSMLSQRVSTITVEYIFHFFYSQFICSGCARRCPSFMRKQIDHISLNALHQHQLQHHFFFSLLMRVCMCVYSRPCQWLWHIF